jgi:uncharacterized membrane protein
MSVALLDTLALAIHQIGVLVWIGSLIFVRLILLPVTTTVKTPIVRMKVRLKAYQQLFRWGWVGSALVWIGGIWALRAFELAKLPLHVQVMAAAAFVMVLLYLIGYIAFFLNMEVAVEEERLVRAAKNNFWLRKLLWIPLFLGLGAALFGVSGPHLLS